MYRGLIISEIDWSLKHYTIICELEYLRFYFHGGLHFFFLLNPILLRNPILTYFTRPSDRLPSLL